SRIRPSRVARTTASVRLCAPSLPRIALTWYLTVCSVMPSAWAMPLLGSPSARSWSTSSSRGVRSSVSGVRSPASGSREDANDGSSTTSPCAAAANAAASGSASRSRRRKLTGAGARICAGSKPSGSRASRGTPGGAPGSPLAATLSGGSQPRSHRMTSASSPSRRLPLLAAPTTSQPGCPSSSNASPLRGSGSSATIRTRTPLMLEDTPACRHDRTQADAKQERAGEQPPQARTPARIPPCEGEHSGPQQQGHPAIDEVDRAGGHPMLQHQNDADDSLEHDQPLANRHGPPEVAADLAPAHGLEQRPQGDESAKKQERTAQQAVYVGERHDSPAHDTLFC